MAVSPDADRAAAAIARLLRQHRRTPDLVVRYGGEECARVLPGADAVRRA